MQRVPDGARWSERGGPLRGAVDLVAGRYPAFLFGRRVGPYVPVFHFHETTAVALEPAFAYLADNGYRTIGSDDLAQLVCQGRRPPDRSVMLAFDDGWASLWIVVGPLLRRFGLRAVAYAIPGRIRDADALRPTIETTAVDAAAADAGATPLATWPELRALVSSGLVDVQSHTWSHSMIFCGDAPTGVVDASFAGEPLFNRPRIDRDDEVPTFLTPADRDAPLFPRRSRMSDARRFLPAAAPAGARPGRPVPGIWESDDERRRAIAHELGAAREVLEARLATRVEHVCLPWGVTGETTRALLPRTGYRTAFANRWRGRLAVAAGDPPYSLKRLHSRFIFALPGRGRRAFVSLA